MFLRPTAEPDAEALISFTKYTADSRTGAAHSGYRPGHRISAEYTTTALHEYLDADAVWPGESARAFLWFLSPELYPGILWPGCVLAVQEGGSVVGTATILKVFNAVLARDGAEVQSPGA